MLTARKPLPFYMDESGFTGQNLLSVDQPLFVHVSTILDEKRCRELAAEFFPNHQAPELKHGVIAKRPAGRDRIVKLIVELQKDQANITSWLVHKEFCLLTFLVDLWVEPAMHADGVDLYEDSGAIALSNMTFFCLRTFEGDDSLRGHLGRFEQMMTARTPENYAKFWGAMHADYRRASQKTKDILGIYLGSETRLGFGHLEEIPHRAIDPALPGAVFTCGHWRKTTKRPLVLVHDRSSQLAKDQEMWELMTSPDLDKMTLGSHGWEIMLPLNVTATNFEDSRSHVQLQICDLVAGATAAWAKRLTGANANIEYAEQLELAGIENFKIGAIWPEMKVTPKELGARGLSGKTVDILADQLKKVATIKKRRPE